MQTCINLTYFQLNLQPKMEYLLQMIKMVDKNHIYVPIYNVNPFYICLLVLLLLKIHILQHTNSVWLFQLQLNLENAVNLSSIELRWLSLAQLNPSLFSIFIPETAIIQFYIVMNIPGDTAFLLHKYKMMDLFFYSSQMKDGLLFS